MSRDGFAVHGEPTLAVLDELHLVASAHEAALDAPLREVVGQQVGQGEHVAACRHERLVRGRRVLLVELVHVALAQVLDRVPAPDEPFVGDAHGAQREFFLVQIPEVHELGVLDVGDELGGVLGVLVPGVEEELVLAGRLHRGHARAVEEVADTVGGRLVEHRGGPWSGSPDGARSSASRGRRRTRPRTRAGSGSCATAAGVHVLRRGDLHVRAGVGPRELRACRCTSRRACPSTGRCPSSAGSCRAAPLRSPSRAR
jgi:hypothetical protein